MFAADSSPAAPAAVDLAALEAENTKLRERLESAEHFTAQTLARATRRSQEPFERSDEKELRAIAYRSVMTAEEALLEVQRYSGTQFDAEIVDALLEHARAAQLAA